MSTVAGLLRPYLLFTLIFGSLALTACGGKSSGSSGTSTPPSTPIAPTASFSFSPASPTLSQSVQFTDASGGSPTSWSWTFGDGATSSSQNPTHAFGTAGTFTVGLTVTNAGGSNTTTRAISASSPVTPAGEVLLPAGQYDMGDHYGFVDPSHPSDEVPIHTVKINAMYVAVNLTTNQQYLDYLNSALASGLITVRNNTVYAATGTEPFFYTHQYSAVYSIGFDGKTFSLSDFRGNHPVVGVLWFGAIAYCNWLSTQRGLQPCYNVDTGVCDFAKNGYRLPTEAEWEYAGRGGQYSPYYNYPYGNDIDWKKANIPDSGDPYEGTDTATYPWTTPVGFYDGKLKLKADYNWPGAATSYQTNNGANAFGLYDMQGNVWQFVYDWYNTTYYSVSPSDNPRGPDAGTPWTDGVTYRNMRGGNWYNGLIVNGVNDGHSRVSNRDPSWSRGPLEQKSSWCMVGFRFVRNATVASDTGSGAPTVASVLLSGFVATYIQHRMSGRPRPITGGFRA